jgi:hypothetical protein
MGENMARVASPATQTEEIEVTKMAISRTQAEQKKCDKVVTLDSVLYGWCRYTPPLDSTSSPQVESNWVRLAYVWSSRGRAAPRRPRRTLRIWRRRASLVRRCFVFGAVFGLRFPGATSSSERWNGFGVALTYG